MTAVYLKGIRDAQRGRQRRSDRRRTARVGGRGRSVLEQFAEEVGMLATENPMGLCALYEEARRMAGRTRKLV